MTQWTVREHVINRIVHVVLYVPSEKKRNRINKSHVLFKHIRYLHVQPFDHPILHHQHAKSWLLAMRPVPAVETTATSLLAHPAIVAIVSTRGNAASILLVIPFHVAGVAHAVARCHAASIRAVLAIRLAHGSIPSSKRDETLLALAHLGPRAGPIVARLAERLALISPVSLRVTRVTDALVRGRAATVPALELAHGLANFVKRSLV